jgi:diguanylate cyclase (GGDEF)-like protein
VVLEYILLITFVVVTAAFSNYIRFKGGELFNKWILLLSSFLLVEIHGYLFAFRQTEWLLFLFISIAVRCFRLVGGMAAACMAWLVLLLQTSEGSLELLLTYLLFSMIVGFSANQIHQLKEESHRRLAKLIDNSKQLKVFREVSFSMQQTLQLQKLLKTILTSVTAGHGLGFNRAMILLVDNDEKTLNGILGTGPMTAEEGFETWERITKNKYKLEDLIQIKEKETSTDSLLNDIVKDLVIPLDESHFFYKTLENGKPIHIKHAGQGDEALQLFTRKFNMNELAVIPLINQGIKVGVLIIDNPVNKKPITASDIDSVMLLANQAAIAIHHSNLYSQIEDMAHKDGLTGLYNQRAFQNLLTDLYPKSTREILSLIILDIDSFKHFNDTNGHMLGNQVLILLAEVIRRTIDDRQIAFRFGGEEFVVLLPNTDLKAASSMAEAIRRNVENTVFPCGDKQPKGRLTISLGVASTTNSRYATPNGLVESADQALYEAKEFGKNQVVVFKGVEDCDRV